MEEPQRRQRTMLSDQLSTAAASLELSSPTSAAASSSNLRDLLTVRQEEDLQPLQQRRRGAGVSLGTALACEKRGLSSPALAAASASASSSSVAATNLAGSSRTLLDIIRDEEGFRGGGGRAYDDRVIIRDGGGHKISWRAFKDRLRIRRANAAWQSTTAAAAGDGDVSVADLVYASPAASPGTLASENSAAHGGGSVPEPNSSSAVSSAMEARRTPTPAVVPGFQCAAPSAVGQEQGGSPAAASPSGEAQQQQQQQQQQPPPQQIRVSLMALLEQTDRQGEGPGFAVSALLEAAGEAEVEAEEEEEEGEGEGSGGEGGKMYVKCCVCMVRHKGAAFIPCGHTFCRLCSRELWVSRGNCPLCNGFILEILDIF